MDQLFLYFNIFIFLLTGIMFVGIRTERAEQKRLFKKACEKISIQQTALGNRNKRVQ